MFPRGSVPSMPWFWSFAAGAALNGPAPRHVDRSTSFLGRTFWSIFLLSNLSIKCLLIRNRFLFSSNAQSQFEFSKYSLILRSDWWVTVVLVVVARLLLLQLELCLLFLIVFSGFVYLFPICFQRFCLFYSFFFFKGFFFLLWFLLKGSLLLMIHRVYG